MVGQGRRGDSEAAESFRISHSICMFGRYAQKRPAGLHVDDNGCIGLNELMRVWGKKEGLTEETVLGAVREHMFHEGSPGALRFAIGESEDLGVWIRVLPKRGQQQQRACATPSRAQWQQQGKQWQQPWVQVQHPGAAPKHVPPKLSPGPGPRGTVGLVAAGTAAAEQQSEGPRASASLQERLTMALDEMIVAEGSSRKEQPPAKDKLDKAHGHGSGSQVATKNKLEMPLDDVIRSESKDVVMIDEASPAKNVGRAASAQGRSPRAGKEGAAGGSGSSWGRRGDSWDNGWNWKSADGWSGRANRRRGRGGRQSWGWNEGDWRQSGADAEERATAWRGRDGSPAPSSSSGSRSRSGSWRRVRGGRRPRGSAGKEPQGGRPARQVPPRPPGPHWTQYQDGGQGGAGAILWWHYDGPLGQWFCSKDCEEPTPYDADP